MTMFGTHRSIYSSDGHESTYLSAQLTVGHARVEYAVWTDSPSACIWLVPPEAPVASVDPPQEHLWSFITSDML